ncbi:hypothetical protein [Devosia sp. RR2S18]|uniref:hypothetical protein n=1 Tax=Devosia rhizosphaerae TaxID=3049774 RepID=UPI0025414FA1|nr:hypothetical protein [Devosia sp. RR2S18]WIJ26416.1 hypothetical protein QOV41_06550 [Devosia sp. RR2S18]
MTTHPLTLVHTETATSFRRPVWFSTVSHWLQVRHRRMRRDCYLALIGRKQKGYPWLEMLMQATCAR